jgi:hypothetical protein
MKHLLLSLLLATAFILTSCGSSSDPSVSARENEAAKRTTRWKWDAQSVVASSKGIIIQQAGNAVEAKLVYLKDAPGFIIDRTISHGFYFPAERKLIFPPTIMNQMEFDTCLQLDVGRVEVSFTPEANVLAARWTGQGVPSFSMDFVRVQE